VSFFLTSELRTGGGLSRSKVDRGPEKRIEQETTYVYEWGGGEATKKDDRLTTSKNLLKTANENLSVQIEMGDIRAVGKKSDQVDVILNRGEGLRKRGLESSAARSG